MQADGLRAARCGEEVWHHVHADVGGQQCCRDRGLVLQLAQLTPHPGGASPHDHEAATAPTASHVNNITVGSNTITATVSTLTSTSSIQREDRHHQRQLEESSRGSPPCTQTGLQAGVLTHSARSIRTM